MAGAEDRTWVRSRLWLVWARLRKTLHDGMRILRLVVLAKMGIHGRSHNRIETIVVIAAIGQLSRGMAENARAESNGLRPGRHFHLSLPVSTNSALQMLGVNPTRKDHSDLGGRRMHET